MFLRSVDAGRLCGGDVDWKGHWKAHETLAARKVKEKYGKGVRPWTELTNAPEIA